MPRRREPLVLRLANAHRVPLPELEWFAEEIERVSSGTMRIRFVHGWTTLDHPTEETATVAAVGRDRADLGWAGTRAFGCLGVRSLDPLQTPFLLEDYEVLDAVCRDDVVREMLAPLDRLGLVGLVMLPEHSASRLRSRVACFVCGTTRGRSCGSTSRWWRTRPIRHSARRR